MMNRARRELERNQEIQIYTVTRNSEIPQNYTPQYKPEPLPQYHEVVDNPYYTNYGMTTDNGNNARQNIPAAGT